MTVQSVQMPAAWSSCTARVTAAISRSKLALRQMNASSAPMANAAMITPFDDLVRVGAQQRPVLERARLALGAVAHDVAAGPGLVGDAGPLPPGREAAAAPASQPGGSDRLDRGLGAHPLCGRDAHTPDVGGEVLVERRDGRPGQQEGGHACSSVARSPRTLPTRTCSHPHGGRRPLIDGAPSAGFEPATHGLGNRRSIP